MTPTRPSRHVARSRALFTQDFFAARAGQGCPAPDPIFILGLTRAGSTLLEQILASHSRVEGTMELPDISALAKRIAGRQRRSEAGAYPEALADFPPEELHALGEEYLSRTQIQRKRGTPLFIDKMPANWMHVGLIHLILPNAKIVDARRHPMALLLLQLQAAFRARPGLHLWAHRSWPLLLRLRRLDGAFRRRAAGARPPRAL